MSIKIGQKIKEKVFEKGLTPTTFAKKIHKDRTTVYQIFDRESIDTLKKYVQSWVLLETLPHTLHDTRL